MESNKFHVTKLLKDHLDNNQDFDFRKHFELENDFKVTLDGLMLRDSLLMGDGLDPDRNETLFREAARILYGETKSKLLKVKTSKIISELLNTKVTKQDFVTSLQNLLSNTYSNETNENVYKLCSWVDWTVNLWKGDSLDTQGFMLAFVSQDANGNKLGRTGKGYSLQALQNFVNDIVEKGVLAVDVPTQSYGFSPDLADALIAMSKEADYKNCDFEYWQKSIDGQECITKGKYQKAIQIHPKASWICGSNQEITYSNWRRYLQIFFTKQLYKDNQMDLARELGRPIDKEMSYLILYKSWKTVFCYIAQNGIPEEVLDYEPTENVRKNLQLRDLLSLYLESYNGDKNFSLKSFKSFIQELDKDNFLGRMTLQNLGVLVEQVGCNHIALPGKPKPYGTWSAPEDLSTLVTKKENEGVTELHLVFENITKLFEGDQK